MLGRIYTSIDQDYKFGFNGEYNDDDVKGSGVQYDYGFRIYDTRIAKFLSVDPLTDDYLSWSPYAFAMNRSIDGIDLDGLELIEYKLKLLDECGVPKFKLYKYQDNWLYYFCPIQTVDIPELGIAYSFTSKINGGTNGFKEFMKDTVAAIASGSHQTDGNIKTEAVIALLQFLYRSSAKGSLTNKNSQIDSESDTDAKTVTVHRSKYFEAADHKDEAQEKGVVIGGKIARPSPNDRRKERMKGVPTVPNKDRDEVPPAVIDNGNGGYSIKHINPSDNSGAGANIKNQINDMPDGTKAII